MHHGANKLSSRPEQAEGDEMDGGVPRFAEKARSVFSVTKRYRSETRSRTIPIQLDVQSPLFAQSLLEN